MARVKTYNTKEVLTLLSEYLFENPGIKVSIPKFGDYIRYKGVDVENHTLRRDKDLRKAIEEINSKSDEVILNDLVTFKTVDIDAFLYKNNSKDKLKDAILTRDKYYANVAARAAEIIKTKNSYQEKINELEEKINELNNAITELENKINDSATDSMELKEKDTIILKLKNILEDYIYPDAANALLKKEGVLEVVNSIVPDNNVKNKSIKADTDITDNEFEQSKFNSVNSLLGGFDE